MQYTFGTKIRATLFGEIYRAKDQNRSDVALKLSNLSQGIEQGENPMNEVLLMKKIALFNSDLTGKKYILKLLDTFYITHKGAAYYCSVLELADEDLLERLQSLAAKGRQMSFRAINLLFQQILQGVSFLHHHRISHLDLSLENILLTRDEVRICDFGQAERRRLFKSQQARKGKFQYMAPEVYNYEPFDGHKADVWSLGVIFWALLTGSLLYQKPNQTDANFRRLVKGKAGIEELLRGKRVFDVPSNAIDLLAGMLSICPASRFTIDDVLQNSWIQSEYKSAPPKKKPLSAPPSPPNGPQPKLDLPRCISDSILSQQISKR
jgi:serine/threonine protein kinase